MAENVYSQNLMRLMRLDPGRGSNVEMIKSQLFANANAQLKAKRDKAMLELERDKFNLTKKQYETRKKQIEAQTALDERKMVLAEKESSQRGGTQALNVISRDPYLGTPQERQDIYGATGFPLTESVTKRLPGGGYAYGEAAIDSGGSNLSGGGGGGGTDVGALQNMATRVSFQGAGPGRLGGAQQQLYNEIMNRIRSSI